MQADLLRIAQPSRIMPAVLANEGAVVIAEASFEIAASRSDGLRPDRCSGL